MGAGLVIGIIFEVLVFNLALPLLIFWLVQHRAMSFPKKVLMIVVLLLNPLIGIYWLVKEAVNNDWSWPRIRRQRSF